MDQLRRLFRARRNRTAHGDAASSVPLTKEDIESIRVYLRSMELFGAPPAEASRLPTDEEVAVAAWANLAVEDPSVTLEDARRIVAELRTSTR